MKSTSKYIWGSEVQINSHTYGVLAEPIKPLPERRVYILEHQYSQLENLRAYQLSDILGKYKLF